MAHPNGRFGGAENGMPREVRLVIDDFGTGHANFDYLTRLVVDSLKIDTSFVPGLGTESRATAIVRSVIGLA